MFLTQNVSKLGPTENRRRFMKIKDDLDFDEFFAEVGVVQMGIFSNSTEFSAINQLCFPSLSFQTTVHLDHNTI